MKAVRPKAQVIKEAKAEGRSVHFGSLMELCSIKNSQLGKEFWTYKGRLVFRGDIVKDENGQFAVFTEQGASASHMAAAKFMDAVSRLPGNSGEDCDAVGAYTQVSFKDAAKILGDPNVVAETWISLPPHKRPKSWDSIEDPVVPLLVNLYGHPIAGLLWDKYQEDKVIGLGFEKIPSWECLYVHYDKRLFLSAYVDDYKMAGRAENIGPMWAAMKASGLDLEPSVPLCKNVYLGCGQVEVEPDFALIREKLECYERVCFGAPSGKAESNIDELIDNSGATRDASLSPQKEVQKQIPTKS